MNNRSLLVLLLFLLWSVGSGWYYVCKIKDKCATTISVQEDDERDYLGFSFNSQVPEKIGDFDEFKSQILKEAGESNKLRIVGKYSLDEDYSGGLGNLGLARASEVRKLFPQLSDDRFIITSEIADVDTTNEIFNAFECNVLMNNERVEETDFGAVLYYSKAIDGDSLDSRIEDYLKSLATRHSDKTLEIIGHHDNSLKEADNFRASLESANRIKTQLAELGYEQKALYATGKGETLPLADNLTEEGRNKNRRVEIIINY